MVTVWMGVSRYPSCRLDEAQVVVENVLNNLICDVGLLHYLGDGEAAIGLNKGAKI